MVCPGPQGLSIRCRIAGNAESDYELGLQSKRGAQMQTERLQQEDLKKIWSTIRKDRYGARALAILKRDGFDLVRIPVESRTWPGMIASIPFLPNLRARSRLLPRPQYLRLSIGFLRELSRSLASPHCHVEAYDPRERIIYMKPSNEMSPLLFTEAVNCLEKMRSWKWVIAEHNPRQHAIASLRWEIRWRTRKPHDKELADLLDATFRACGLKESSYMASESLKKTETTERETRKAARRKLLGGRPL